MVPGIVNNTKSTDGFTLLELLVTIALVSMVVLILAMALKLAVGAWERGQKGGEASLVEVTIPSLLEKQLKSIVQSPGTKIALKGMRFSFCGEKNAFSFFSCFSPMGSELQGVLRITYVYDADKKMLSLYEQPITRPEDLKEELNPLSENYDGGLEPISVIDGVETFELMYSARSMVDPEDTDQWKDQWPCNSMLPPKAIRLAISMQEEESHGVPLWYFRVGPEIGF